MASVNARLPRIILKIALGVFALAAAPVLAMITIALLALPDTAGTISLPGAAEPVRIERDRHGVPWISAASATDAYFALGYVHAQDRLFQMELTRRTGQGRLAEIIGATGVGSDKFMRTLGLYRLAQDQAARLDPEIAAMVNAYVNGINAFLDHRRGPLPIEFTLLWFDPEPWQPADALVWQKLMGLQLSGNWNEELLRAQLVRHLGPEKAAALFPDISRAGPVTVADAAPSYVGALRTAMTRVVEPTLASNIWALAPARTATGGAILANDPHLNFGAPNLWYLAGLSYPGVTLTGATVPGVPFHLLGHNGRLAWGFTTTHGDTQDLFIESVIDDATYQGPTGPTSFETAKEAITVRFGAPVEFTVRRTDHGPVVSDLLSPEKRGSDRTALALSATLLAPDDRTVEGIYRMARATSVQDFLAASAQFHAPQQNAMFADAAGGIGYTVVGRAPMRRNPDCQGLAPVSAVAGHCEWIGWVPARELPQRLNPSEGVLINANNRVVGADYPYLIAADWPESYRAERIEATIADRAGITVDETIHLQLDQVSLMARDLLPVLLSQVDGETLQHSDLIAALSRWQGNASRERVEPLALAAWMAMVKQRLLADDLGTLYDEFFGERPTLIKSILTDAPAWCDVVATSDIETCAGQTTLAWHDAIRWLTDRAGPDPASWSWQSFHVAEFQHPLFGAIPGLEWVGSFSIATGGDNATVNRGSPARASARRPFRHRHGPGYRAVYDLADLSRSRFTLAGGQSGQLFSRHADDLLTNWRDGRYFELRRPTAGDPDVRLLELRPVQ
jgi:penicillin amidase